jgi:hypothetical protein
MTKQNLPPFTPSGDINDALFLMPKSILHHSSQLFQTVSATQTMPLKLRHIFETDTVRRPIERPLARDSSNVFYGDEEHIYGICTPKVEYSDGLSQVFPRCQLTIDNESKTGARFPCLPAEASIHIDHDIYKRNDLTHVDERIKIASYFHRLAQPEREFHLEQFAKQMQKNLIQFENVCLMSETVAQRLGSRKY